MKYNDIKNYSTRLIETNNTIMNQYEKILKYIDDNNYEKYNECIENLKLAIFVENNILKEMNLITEEEINNFFYVFNYILEIHNTNKTNNELISKRLENYYNDILYSIPYKSENEDNDKKTDEDTCKIMNCISTDYTINLFIELSKRIDIEEDRNIRDYLNEFKYQTIAQNKDIEKKFVNNQKIRNINFRNKLENYDQDPATINSLYLRYLADTVNETLSTILSITDKIIDENKEILIENLIILKSILKLATTKDIETLSKQIFNIFLNSSQGLEFKNTSSTSINELVELFNEIENEENENNKELKKVMN